jgi:hypothetical protein
MPQPKLSDDILAAALEGFEAQKTRIETKIAEIRGLLGGTAVSSDTEKPRRKVSASARRRMARAQKLRWKKVKQTVETAKPKRQMSAGARKRIAAAQKKRWAAIKKAAEPKPAVARKAWRKRAVARKPKVAAPEQSATVGA